MAERPINWLDPDQIGEAEWLERVKESTQFYHEWDKRWLTSLAVGNGAALVAVGGALLQVSEEHPTNILLTSAWIFLVGVIAASFAGWCRARQWANFINRHAWLAREPQLFAPQIKAQVEWRERPWYEKITGHYKAVDGVDPRHPSLKYMFRANRWANIETSLTLISVCAFVGGVASALVARTIV